MRSDMITEDFVSFNVAKLLKEKGFDELCIFKYNSEGVRMKAGVAIDEWQNSELDDDECSCVSHQMATKWLREVHKLLISVDASPIYGKVKDEKGRNTCGLLYWYYMASGEWMNDKYNPQQKAFVVSGKSYEEAVEAACIYSLEKLI